MVRRIGEIPPAKYWFKRDVRLAPIVFVLTIGLALIGVRSSMTSNAFWALEVAALLASLAEWWKAAQNAEDAAERSQTLEDQREILLFLKRAEESRLATGLDNLSGLPSGELKRRVHNIAQRMRKLQDDTRRASERWHSEWMATSLKDKQQAVAKFTEMGQKSSAEYKRRDEFFSREVRPEAYAL